MYATLRHYSVFLLLLTGAPLAAWADRGDDQYLVAATHYRSRRWELAADEFRDFLTSHPDHARAHTVRFFLGETLVQLGQLPAAEEQFREYLRREPQGTHAREAQFRLGEALYLAGRHDQAAAELERFRGSYEHDALVGYVHAYLGEIALSREQLEDAHREFGECLRRFPDAPVSNDCRYGLARTLQKQGDPEGAARFFQFLADLEAGCPWSDPALFQLGVLRYQQGDYSAAVHALTRHRTRFPASDLGASAAYWLGLSQTESGDCRAAIETLASALRQFSEHSLAPDVHFAIAEACRRSGDVLQATDWYQRLLDRWPEHRWSADSLQTLIHFAWEAEQYDRLSQLADRFARDYSDSPLRGGVEQLRARAEIKQGAYRAAIARLEQSYPGPSADREPVALPTPNHLQSASSTPWAGEPREGSSTDAAGLYYLALAYLGDDRPEQALAALDRIMSGDQLADLSNGIATARAAALFALERYADSVAPLRLCLQQDPAGVNAEKCRAQLAVALARLSNWDDVQRVWEEMRDRDLGGTWYLPTVEHLAELAAAQEQTELAARLFQDLADGDHPTETVARALAGLARLQWRSDGGVGPSARTWERLLRMCPDSPLAAEAALMRGRSLEQSGQGQDALALYVQVIQQHGQSSHAATAMIGAARIHQQLGEYYQAEGLLRAWLTAHPTAQQREATLYQLGWVLVDASREDAADEVFHQLRSEYPAGPYWADATYRLAERAARRGDPGSADQLAREIIEASDNRHRDEESTGRQQSRSTDSASANILQYALYLRGELAAAQQRWDDAHQWMERVASDHPCSPLRLAAQYWAGESLYRLRRYRAAGDIFDRLACDAAELDEPWVAMVALRQAQVRAYARRWDEAYTVASDIATRFPGFSEQHEVDYLLGRFHASRGELREAREAYERVVRSPHGGKSETAAMAQWMIGETLFMQQQYQEAIRAYHRVEALYPYPRWQAAALLQAGKCCEMLGRWPEAVERYQQILQQYAHTEAADQATHRLSLAREQLNTIRTR